MHEFTTAFEERVAYMAKLDTQYESATQEIARLIAIISRLLTKLNWCGVMLVAQLLLAIATYLTATASRQPSFVDSSLLWLIASGTFAVAYGVIRPTSLRHLAARIMHRNASKQTPFQKSTSNLL